MTKQTPEERREKNRLRSERWRRAHGIGPRKPAQKPWLALGVSRATLWYRRRKQAHEQAAQMAAVATTHAAFKRAEVFIRELHADLARAARCHAIATGLLRSWRRFSQAA